MRVVVALALCACALGLAHAATPRLRELYLAGDLAELRRRGEAAPIAGVRDDLAATDRATAYAAMAAVVGHDDAPLALTALAQIAGGWDRARAAPATTTARRIVATLDDARAIRDDLDDDLLAEAAAAWLAVADRADRWSDVRAGALGIAVALTQARAATAATAPDLPALLAPRYVDADPEVRLAALESTPAPVPAPLVAPTIARLTGDPVAAVRLVAAQVLCAVDAEAAIAAMGPAGRAAMVAAVAGPLDRPGALLDLARCLAADDDPASARALATLRQRAPRALRAPLAALARRPRP
ncbi:MAG: hypothetical protein IPL61_02240 [Myxococcales bacterium]|nr:hypothetical protein [Myxococcales bacterium]